MGEENPTLVAGPTVITKDTDLSDVRFEFSAEEIAQVFDSVLYDQSGVVVHEIVSVVIAFRMLES